MAVPEGVISLPFRPISLSPPDQHRLGKAPLTTPCKPDALYTGTPQVMGGGQALKTLARGISRHPAFGMLLLRPRGEDVKRPPAAVGASLCAGCEAALDAEREPISGPLDNQPCCRPLTPVDCSGRRLHRGMRHPPHHPAGVWRWTR